MKLFMINVGGKAEYSNIEIHDVQFVVADSIEETFDVIKKRWFGIEKSLHIDSYKIIEGVEGYKVKIISESSDSKKLFLVNVGGYIDGDMTEKHKTQLMVCDDLSHARSRASGELFSDLNLEHIDNVIDIGSTIEEYSIQLEHDGENYDTKPTWYGFMKLS